MNINTLGMEPLIRLQNLSAPSLNMELFSVIQGSLRRPTGSVFRHARTFSDLLIIVKNDTLYENSPMDETTLYHALIDTTPFNTKSYNRENEAVVSQLANHSH